ncbi:MAG: C4-dicarboxylate transporter DcuC [Solidesulfovibrio sp.]|uniref:C4-dicarboxylate transporter DcuC n=1 Tax=Solidesulfovibrio sp. TaxID=2910990 RepID=UPI002B21A649|nr:C4-dicarboxylate transporter DcuC [Solidesulfovibrio sp.]MEA4856252.1 C4-dicarboxylate transporter DcuC [Solidesulfovibrio sp.]
MLGLLISGLVVAWIAWAIAKKTYAPAVLLVGGMVLITIGGVMGITPILSVKKSTGLMAFDIFEAVRNMFSTRLAGLGLNIMMIAGYSRYMDHLHASTALYSVVAAPLRYMKSQTLIFTFAFLITQCLSIFVPSGAGMALLTMVTVYPILVRTGMSRLTALALVGVTRMFGWGPASPNLNYACQILNIDAGTYFLKYQTPIVLPMIFVVLVAMLLVQKWWDKKEGPDLEGRAMLSAEDTTAERPPLIYAILPVLPLCFILACSPLVTNYFHLNYKVNMDVGTAMFMCTFIALGFEIVRYRSLLKTLPSLKKYFEAMGQMFTLVVALIVAGEVLAKGLVNTGALKTMIDSAQAAGLGYRSMTIASSFIVIVSAFLMGSGNAAFFSFGAMIPEFAKLLNVSGEVMMVILDLMSCYGRSISPVFGAIIAIAGMAGCSPFQVAKRTAIPVIVCAILTPIWLFIYFG